MAITHTYVSSVPDDGNPNKVGSSEWNEAHTIAAGTIVTANIADANVTLAKMAANSVDASKVVDGSLTIAELSLAGSLDGTHVKEGTVEYANGMVPVLYVFDVGADGAEVDVTVTNKLQLCQFTAMKVTNEASGAFTITVKNGSNACAYLNFLDSFNSAGCFGDWAVVAVPAQLTIADGGTIKVSASGASNMGCQVYVMGFRVA